MKWQVEIFKNKVLGQGEIIEIPKGDKACGHR